MSEKPKEGAGRDELDRRISAVVRAARVPHGVPARGGLDPSDEALLRVVGGTATAADRRAVEGGGAYTRDRLEILRGALAETDPVGERVARVARLVFAVARDSLDFLRGSAAPLAAPELAWVTRGGEAPVSEPFYEFRQDFAGIEAQIRVEHVTRPQSAASLDVQVKLFATGGAPADSGRVTIRRGGRTIDSTPVESGGSAIFTGLTPDRYELELRTTGKVVGVVLLDFLAA